MQSTPTPQAARRFAVINHGGQRYGPHPYSFHLDQVAHILEPYGELAQVLGYLHDVQEDAGDRRDIVRAAILDEFGTFVSHCVDLVSDTPGLSRKERKDEAHKKLATVIGVAEIVLIVKLADRVANIQFCIDSGNSRLLKMYTDEFAAFRESAYRPGLCDTLWLHVEQLLGLPGPAGMSP
jgi:(p)ppGpp synthase/HD superfamily hydrolase